MIYHQIPTSKNPILPTIGAAAVTGIGLGIGFKAVSWATDKLLKNSKKESRMTKRMNPGTKRHRVLSVPEKHQLRIAKHTLKLSDVGAIIMGGPTKAEAREIIMRLTGRYPKENPGAQWHEDRASELRARTIRKQGEGDLTPTEYNRYFGAIAESDFSADASRKLGMNPRRRNPSKHPANTLFSLVLIAGLGWLIWKHMKHTE